MKERMITLGQRTLTTQQVINIGVEHHNSGRSPEAEGLYQQILQSNSHQPVVLNLLGVIAYQVGKHDVAIEFFTKSINLLPDYAEAHNNLGSALQKLGKHDEARRSHQKALTANPNFAEAHHYLGNVLKTQKRLNEAVFSYQRSLAIRPNRAEVHFDLGNTLCDQGKLNDAVASYQAAIDIAPKYAEAFCNLGSALNQLKKLGPSATSYKQALAIKPDFLEAHYNLGVIYTELGHHTAAMLSFQQALILNSKFNQARVNLGTTLKLLGRMNEAISCFQEAIAIEPNNAQIYYNLGTILMDVGLVDDAALNYRMTLDLDPNHVSANNNLANLLMESGQLADAITHFQQAINRDQDCDTAWAGLQTCAIASCYVRRLEGKNHNSYADGLIRHARTSAAFAILEYTVKYSKPHLCDAAYNKAILALPSISTETIAKGDGINGAPDTIQAQGKIVALLHFGRSGTGLLHSLVDGHPQVATLPATYLRGYFNARVWDTLSAGGRGQLPERFVNMFAVLFDSKSSKPTPGPLLENSMYLGVKEGMTRVGESRDGALSIDPERFCSTAHDMMQKMGKVGPASFFRLVHAVIAQTIGITTENQTIFYHIHNPDDYSKLNFLRYEPDARLIMMVRDPIQSCESWIRSSKEDDDYGGIVSRIITMLFSFDQIPFRKQETIGIRIEDLKGRHEDTLYNLCNWLGIEDAPCLYEMTAQGQLWWGDPTSPHFDSEMGMSPFGDWASNISQGGVLGDRDKYILETLFYPFSVKFGYREANLKKFRHDLKEIRPMLDGVLEFEQKIIERSNADFTKFKKNSIYLMFRARLIDRWDVLDEFSDYPNMIEPLSITK